MTVDDLLLLAAVLSAVAGFWQLKRYHDSPVRIGPVAGTETWAVEEIDALREGSVEANGIGRFRRQVSVVATAAPGPDGPLKTREGEVECVWWRTETTRHFVALVDGEQIARTELIGQNWSRAPFTLIDPTGALTVWPEGADVTGAPQVHREVQRFAPEAAASPWSALTDKDSTTAVVTVEYALREGDRLLVHGEANDRVRGDLAIAKSTQDMPYVISTKEERALRERATRAGRAAEALRMRGYALLGLAVVLVVLFYWV